MKFLNHFKRRFGFKSPRPAFVSQSNVLAKEEEIALEIALCLKKPKSLVSVLVSVRHRRSLKITQHHRKRLGRKLRTMQENPYYSSLLSSSGVD